MTDEETCYEFGDIQYEIETYYNIDSSTEIEVDLPLLSRRCQSLAYRLAAIENCRIALQRAIEHHCAGKPVPDNIACHCRYYAEKLNANLEN